MREKRVYILSIIWGIMLILGSVSGSAALGTAFSYQGQLVSSGSPVTGICDFEFSLYDDASAGSQIGVAVTKTGISVTKGLFTTKIDFGIGVFDGQARWLDIGVKCGADPVYTPLSPRQELTPTPYAIYGGNVVFENHSGVVRNTGSHASDDFVFGSPQLADDGDYYHAARMFFDKSKAAFRAGAAATTQWDDANVGPGSVALGDGSTASGLVATALGMGSTASGWVATALGEGTTASGSTSTALGYYTTASGFTSTALGRYTTANGDYSLASGYATTANGDYSLASGYVTTASGEASTALGKDTTASGEASTAMGRYTTANGEASTALGMGTTASGEASTALGVATHAESYVETVLGRYDTDYTPASSTNWDDSDRLFVIGNGTSSARADALVMLKSGDTTLNGNLTVNGDINYSGSLNYTSDRALKENLAAVNAREILTALADLPIQSWNYTTQDATIRHLGPMAQDFYAAFTLGEHETTISTIDADGVALVAIQGLYQIVQERDATITALEARITALEAQNAQRAAQQATLDLLMQRLIALEQAAQMPVARE